MSRHVMENTKSKYLPETYHCPQCNKMVAVDEMDLRCSECQIGLTCHHCNSGAVAENEYCGDFYCLHCFQEVILDNIHSLLADIDKAKDWRKQSAITKFVQNGNGAQCADCAQSSTICAECRRATCELHMVRLEGLPHKCMTCMFG